jgi:4-hydroxy-tetrahydrodipicolinate synthase
MTKADSTIAVSFSGRSGCMIAGSMVALVTPMDAQGALDWDSLSKLVDFHLQEGTDAIVAVGTTGESATLTVPEHVEVIRRVVDQVNGKIPVIAGTGANCTREAIELTTNAKNVGADACLLVTPYYNKPTQEGLYLHFRAIAEAVAIPQILYNVPGRTVCDMLPDTVERLSKVANIIGIKEATGDLQRAQEILDRVSQDFLVYSGDDPTAFELILLGGKGNISVTANVAPRAMSDLCSAAMRGEAGIARAINDRLMPLHKALFLEANPIPVKWALHEMGMMPDGIRLPLTWLSERYHEPLRQAMRQTGVLS